MFVKKLIQKSPVRAGKLKSLHLNPHIDVHHGIPPTSSVLAFEPIQRLLAIGSRHGQIKIFGGEGIESLLESPVHAPCRFLEFFNNKGLLVRVTTLNDIEVWDFERREIICACKWKNGITAFSIIQGSSFMYVGDEDGHVAILHFSYENRLLSRMPYCIPVHATLGGLIKQGGAAAPSVVSVLPQVNAVYSRVLIVYGNGLIVLWGLHENEVLAVRGGTDIQQAKLAEHAAGLPQRRASTLRMFLAGVDEEEDKETCCACWTCYNGSIVAVGYTDGDVWLWSIPVISKAKGALEKADSYTFSNSPLLKLSVSPDISRMPVVVLRWCSHGNISNGVTGYLIAFGGQKLGDPEGVMVFPVTLTQDDVLHNERHLVLPLDGDFADVHVLHSISTNAGAAILMLTSSGNLNVYEVVDIASVLDGKHERTVPESVPYRLPFTKPHLSASKLSVIQKDGKVANIISRIRRLPKGFINNILPCGTKWPVTGGMFNSSCTDGLDNQCLYFTGHENGSVNVWDASNPAICLITSIQGEPVEDKSRKDQSVTAIDFCALSGILATGNQGGLVCLYTLGAETAEVACVIQQEASRTTVISAVPAGFQRFCVLNVHKAAVQCISVASDASCVISGDEAGQISVYNLESGSLSFHGACFSATSSRVIDLAAANINESLFTSTPPPSPRQSPISKTSAVFVLSEDCHIAVIDGNNGNSLGSGVFHPKTPSTAVSMYLLDSLGVPATSLSRAGTPCFKQATEQNVEAGASSEVLKNSQDVPVPGFSKQEKLDVSKDNMMLLLCSTDSLRLYSLSSIFQGSRNTIRKVRLDKTCCWASVFENGTADAVGLLLLYTTGHFESRSLPDLDVIKEISLGSHVNLEIEISGSSKSWISCSIDGRVALVSKERELVFLSLFAEEKDKRLTVLPHLFDKDVAAATEAALMANLHLTKRKSQVQGVLGEAIREFRQSLVLGEPVPLNHTVAELDDLFSAKQSMPMPATPTTSGSTPGSQVDAVQPALDIDDIEIEDEDDDDDVTSQSPVGHSPSIMSKFKKSLKGKKKVKDQPRSSIHKEDTERDELFEDGSLEKQPTVRTAEEIRAAYGHKKTGDSSSVAAQARDKLLERQEKLQAINRRTEEMQAGAENFASLAAELAKKMEAKKWWEI